jgi:aerobic carbon-monoxide dehydrogenase small subunit
LVKTVKFKVNGNEFILDVEPNKTLLDILRNNLGLTGTKYGCGTGDCGACTVLIDGKPKCSCLVLAQAVEGKDILTIEGLYKNNKLDPIQDEFVKQGAIQCGYCTPGFVMITKALLGENPDPTESFIRHYIKGNICRCTGYTKIVQAILGAAKRINEIKMTV